MLNLKIHKEENKDVKSVNLRLIKCEDDIQVEDVDTGYVIVGFRVINDKVNLVRYGSVNNKNFNTDSSGFIEEVEE